MHSNVHRLATCVVVAALASIAMANAQPTGGTVVYGGATIGTPNPTSTLITQTTNAAIINWQSFSLASGSSVVFDQPNAAAIALNRVLGGGVSQINGNLQANGQVWIINANGILFGKGSQINVAGLLATTSDIADSDFAAGRYDLSTPSTDPSASVDNAGTIHVASGGSAVLSAPHVSNSGLIQADAGQIVLGGASAFTLDFDGDNLLRYAITTPVTSTPGDANGVPRRELVANSGTLSSAGGKILLTARAAANVADNVVNNTGMISAASASIHDGEVVLDAGDGTVEAGGTIAATGNSAGENGGNITLAGHTVNVADNAVIDASGDQGGGTIAIGGGLHGTGAYQAAQNTNVGNATIHADAHTNGNGGTVSIWSSGNTQFAGTVTAMGGSQSGGGGMVETSGHVLNVADSAMVNTGAANGQRGQWLLDPLNLTIVASSPTPDPTLSGGTLPYSDPSSTITATTISNALAAGTDVTLQAVDDITVNAAIGGINSGRTLTLDAGRSIYINASINMNGNGGTLVLSANNPGANRTDPGAAVISGSSVISGDFVNLILASDGSDGGSIGTAAAPIRIGNGVVSIQTSGADSFIQSESSTKGLFLGSSNVGAGHFYARSFADLTLVSGAVISSSGDADAITLAAFGNFVNNAGSGALSLTGSGRFLVYSAAPAGDTFGALDSGNTAIWNTGFTIAVAAAGNRYVFALKPTLTITSTDQAKTYGTDATSAVAGAYTVSGFDPGVANVYLADTAASALSGTPSVTSTGSGAGASVSGGPYTITVAKGSLSSPNGYALSFVSSGKLTIDPATLTYVANAANRLYGASNPVFSGTVTGFVNGDTLASATGGTLAFTSPATAASNVGSYAINGSGLTANHGNYVFVQAAGNATALTINPATLTYVADPFSRAYGSANPVFTGTVTGFAGGDTLASATSGTLTFTSPATAASNVGSYAINGSGLSANNGNYVFVQAASNATALSITAALLSVTADPLSKVYGASDPTLTYSVSGLVNGDTSSVFSGALSRAAGENVGGYAIGQGSLSAGSNYAIAFTGANFSITPALLSVSASPQSKVYGTSDPALTYSFSGLVNGDTSAVFVGALGRAAGENAGNYAINQGTLSAGGNYTIAFTGANFAITKALLSVMADPQSKVYGASDPALTYSFSGLANGDTSAVFVGALGRAAGQNAGVYAINIGTLSAGANYTIAFTGANLTITKALLSVTANPQTKVYGTVDPALTYGFSGLVNGDTSAVFVGALGRAAGKNVGNYAITLGSLSAGGNYTIAFTSANFSITPALLSVTANSQTKVYGANDPKLSFTSSGLVAGDTSAVFSGALGRAAGQNVGNYAISQGTLSAGANYIINFTGANFAITPATLTYVATSVNRTYGDANPALSGKVTGFVNGDTLASATTGTLSFDTSATASSNVGSYAITGSGLTANNGNYVFVQAAGNATALTINPATLTYIATVGNIDFGTPIPALSGTVSGFVNGDTMASATSGTLIFTTPATSSSPPGVYAIDGSGLTALHGNYVFVQDPGNAQALTINKVVVEGGPPGLGGYFPWQNGGDRPTDPDSPLGVFAENNSQADQYYVEKGPGTTDLPAPDLTTLSGPIAELTAGAGYLESPTNTDRRSSSLSRYFNNGSLFDANFPSWGNDLFWH